MALNARCGTVLLPACDFNRDVARRLSEDVQSSVQLHSRIMSSQSLDRMAPYFGGKFAPAAAEASASAISPSSVTSRLTQEAAFSIDGSSIAGDVRSSQSRVNMSLRDAREASRPSTFGEAARVATPHAQPLGNVHSAAEASASAHRHRILGEIEGLMRALKTGGGRA